MAVRAFHLHNLRFPEHLLRKELSIQAVRPRARGARLPRYQAVSLPPASRSRQDAKVGIWRKSCVTVLVVRRKPLLIARISELSDAKFFSRDTPSVVPRGRHGSDARIAKVAATRTAVRAAVVRAAATAASAGRNEEGPIALPPYLRGTAAAAAAKLAAAAAPAAVEATLATAARRAAHTTGTHHDPENLALLCMNFCLRKAARAAMPVL